MQSVVLSSTLKRALEGIPTVKQGISVEERSVDSEFALKCARPTEELEMPMTGKSLLNF